MATRSPTFGVVTPGADLLDDPDALVTGDERRGRLDRPVAVGGVDVGVAQACGLDLDQDLARAGYWLGHVLDAERFGEIVDDCCLHEDLLASLARLGVDRFVQTEVHLPCVARRDPIATQPTGVTRGADP